MMNTDKKAIRRHIEQRLHQRLTALYPEAMRFEKKRHSAKVLNEQASFIAGAMAALQATFAPNSNELTDYASPAWVLAAIRGEVIKVSDQDDDYVPTKDELQMYGS